MGLIVLYNCGMDCGVPPVINSNIGFICGFCAVLYHSEKCVGDLIPITALIFVELILYAFTSDSWAPALSPSNTVFFEMENESDFDMRNSTASFISSKLMDGFAANIRLSICNDNLSKMRFFDS